MHARRKKTTGLMGLMGLTERMGRLRDGDSKKGAFMEGGESFFCQVGKNVFANWEECFSW